jgi:hypothetical protein
MQPYFLPYIGYWQLINTADTFVIYDNIQFTKKGWINRNRMLQNGKESLFSIALKKDSDYLDVKERVLSPAYDRIKFIRQIKNTYSKAAFVDETFPIIEKVILNENNNLFNYISNSVLEICRHLELDTRIIASSELNINHSLKGEEKVISICNELSSTSYVNAIGGVDLYDKQNFLSQGIELSFIKSKPIEYQQFGNEFVPWLSILDVLMFNGKAGTQKLLNEKELV